MPKLTLGITGKNVLFKVILTQPRSQESSPPDGGRVREDPGNQVDLPLNVLRIVLVA